MPDTLIARAVESRAEVESLDALHAERRALLADYARLRALHGAFGIFDAKRKAMLSAVAVRVRMELQAKQEKVTEAFIDTAAHADEQYQRFLDESYADKIRFIEVETAISEIEERVRSRETELLCYRAELGLR